MSVPRIKPVTSPEIVIRWQMPMPTRRKAPLVSRQQTAAETPRQALAAPAHDHVVIPAEGGVRKRGEQAHPALRYVDVPLVDDGGDAVLLEEAPASDALEAAGRVPLDVG